MINPLKINSKNLTTYKKKCVTLACHIVHARDNCCWVCAKSNGKLDAAHIVPRSRGFLFASDPENILLTCCHHHRLGAVSMHSDESWMWAELQAKQPERYAYIRALLQQRASGYMPNHIGVEVVRRQARMLNELAARYGVGGK